MQKRPDKTSRRGKGTQRPRGDVARIDTLDPTLPVAGTGRLSHVRASKNARRRAAVLIVVHLLVGAHIAHYLSAGETLSPVEPSETMYTLELGLVNAGFVLLLVTLAGTLVFGRFFCGWACHLVALQDLCGWIMKRMRIRPRPFRSRFLVFAPLVLAFYMFAWPTLKRAFIGGEPFPGFTNDLMTTSFWETFPGPVFTVLTFASCGFAAVYFLGAKGFCTYGCPYGALFGAADRLAPGRIVVSDACEQCGHCTATCTSNVLVHEEVRLYGRVVDSGCMKCMDCVSVCPKNALSFGFAAPSLVKSAPASERRARRYSYSLGEELFLAALFLGATLTFRGLYDGPPLLMSMALAGITSFVGLELWHLARRPTVRLQNLSLKLSGTMQTSGWVFASLALAWLLFGTHSAHAQWHRTWGRYHLNRTEPSRADVLSREASQRTVSKRHRRAADASYRHFTRADRFGLVDIPEVKLGLAWGHLLRDEPGPAEALIRESIALSPSEPQLHENLVELLIGRGRTDAAADALAAKIAASEPAEGDHFRLGGLYAAAQRYDDAIEAYRESIALAPDAATTHYNLGGVLRRLERYEEAALELRLAEQLAPGDADTQVELGLALMALGNSEDALGALRRAVELNPASPESLYYLPGLIERLASETRTEDDASFEEGDDAPR